VQFFHFHNDTFVIFTAPFGCVQRLHNKIPWGDLGASPHNFLAMGAIAPMKDRPHGVGTYEWWCFAAAFIAVVGSVCELLGVWMIAWQQHDVQELCRAMFDALELTWQNTNQSNVINELYEGKMKDCVQCLQVLEQPLTLFHIVYCRFFTWTFE